MKLAYFESMDVTLGKGRLSSVLKNSCIHASIQKKAIRHGQPISYHEKHSANIGGFMLCSILNYLQNSFT